MVTVRQFSRGVGRTLRAMEREAQRQQRQQFIYQKALEKQATLNAAADAAAAYERLVSLLTQSHQTPFVRRDWSAAEVDPPPDPVRQDAMERKAAAALAAYSPGWIARTFGIAKRERARLAAAVERGRLEDAKAHGERVAQVARRRDEIDLAKAVKGLQAKAMLAAVNQHANFNDAAIEYVNLLAKDGRVIAVVDAFELEDMPTHSVSLLQSGKASRKPLPAGKLMELHRDSVCSSAIRVAAELLCILPLDAVEVVMETDLLDRGSGHIRAQPVLYLRATAQALGAVNLKLADATPLAERLGAHFDWTRKEGMRPINLGPFELPQELFEEEPA